MNGTKRTHTSSAVGLRTAGIALFLGLLALAPAASANEANLTRFGPEIYERELGTQAPTSRPAYFRAMEGPANLVLQGNGVVNAKIKVNGLDVVGPKDFRGNGETSSDPTSTECGSISRSARYPRRVIEPEGTLKIV